MRDLRLAGRVLERATAPVCAATSARVAFAGLLGAAALLLAALGWFKPDLV